MPSNQLRFIKRSIIVVLGIALTAFTAIKTPVPAVRLYKICPFPFGAAINTNLMQNIPAYKALVDSEYNSITPETAMKIAVIHPAENTYNWKEADYLVNYAAKRKIRVHGHTLIWYKSLPPWVTNFKGDSTAWEHLMKTHIQTVMAHYKGKVNSWDVVNEAFEKDGTIRKSIWQQHLGNDYIARCFQYAQQADPHALLFYNDFGQEYSQAKLQAIIAMVQNLKSRGIKLDGLGIQMHTSLNIPDIKIASAINTLAKTGLKIHISEMDVSLNQSNQPNAIFTAELAARQAEKYKAIMHMMLALPASQAYGITTWNVADSDSWVRVTYKRPDWPLPFDDNYNRKPAYQGLLDGLKN